ncbi:MAG TPA: hypothetical protein VMR70_02545 [Flavisolibacter sp.]|nr:hypothetical protein [Flavisolibacter sp.]
MKANTDLEFLKDVYAAARNKYKPRRIETLLVAEGPPDNLERYFYFEDVKTQDSLFLEIMGVLYPEQKKRYLASGRETALKAELLEMFQEDGFWLLDVAEVPQSVSNQTLEDCLPSFLQQLQKTVNHQTPIILIKANVYDLCYPVLISEGYNVAPERLPFPGSGQQKVFREKFRKVLG